MAEAETRTDVEAQHHQLSGAKPQGLLVFDHIFIRSWKLLNNNNNHCPYIHIFVKNIS
jgi:hypothetical protein